MPRASAATWSPSPPMPASSSPDGEAGRGSHRGLSPAISIEQKSTSHNRARPSAPSPKSTTTCVCCLPGSASRRCRPTPSRSPPRPSARWWIRCWPSPGAKLMLLAPWCATAREHTKLLENLAAQGLYPGPHRRRGAISPIPALELHKKHTIEVVVDRFKVRDDLACAWPSRSRRR